MSFFSKIQSLRNRLSAATSSKTNTFDCNCHDGYRPRVKQKTPEEEKAEKIAEIAENRRWLHDKVGDKPFEVGYNGYSYGMSGCLITNIRREGDVRKLTIVNPIYQFDTPDTFKLVGGRVFERQKMYDESTGCSMILKDVDIKKISAEEFRQIEKQQKQALKGGINKNIVK